MTKAFIKGQVSVYKKTFKNVRRYYGDIREKISIFIFILRKSIKKYFSLLTQVQIHTILKTSIGTRTITVQAL